MRQQLRGKRFVRADAGHADRHGQSCDVLRITPLEKGQEHIGSHQQIQLILRIAFPKRAQRIHSVTRAGTIQFNAADLHTRFSCYGKLCECKTRLAVR